MKKFLFLIFLIFLISCSRRTIVKNFDFSEWRRDSCGCLHIRENLSDTLIKYKDFFLDLDTAQVFKYLGQPNHKYQSDYLFYVTPGPECLKGDSSGIGISLIVNNKGRIKYITKVLLD